MITLTSQRGLRPASSRTVLSAALTSTGCATLLLAAAGVHAQQQPAATVASNDTLGEIVVTGIRHGIEDAIGVKRDSGSIVEAVSAEDIGKLPDTSIAESISRLPGLTSQRAEGRASAISLRGTDPGFTTALLNGREQVSTGDNRSIEFDQYPSELLSGVVVYKTPDAQLIGQGLAGTIELNTTRPLEYGKRAFVVNLRGEQNGNNGLGADSTDHGFRASISYIDQFADGRLGLTIGYAHLSSPLATEGIGTYEPWNPTGTGIYGTGGAKVRTDMGKNVRDGAMAALEWKPSETFTSILDVYYTKSDETDNARSIEVNLGGYPAPCCDGTFPAGTVFGLTNPIVSNNTYVGGILNTVMPLVRNFQFITNDKIIATGWNNKWSSGGWTVAGDLSYSRATRDQFQPETNAEFAPLTGQPAGTPVLTYDTGYLKINGDSPPSLTFTKDYTDAARMQIGPTIYGAGYAKLPHVQDELKSARVDVGRELSGWIDNVAAGINYADRSKDKRSPESGLSTINGFSSIAAQYLLAPTNLSYAGAPSVLAWDVPAVLAAYYKPIVWGTPQTLSYLVGKYWTVHEKQLTGFVKGNLNHELSSSVTLKGNVGLQLINTDQSSDAFFSNTATGAVTPFTAGKKYTDVLPEINLVFAMQDQQSVRLSIAREVARPRMDQLKASREWGVDKGNGLPGGSQGNPYLDPWRANALDLSYEKYFGNKAYVSLAAFGKQLKTYIYDQKIGNYDFSSLLATLPGGYLPPGVTAQQLGSLTQPVNGNGGNLKGVELSVSLPGDMLADGLRNFGTILSFSQTDSNIQTKDISGSNVLPGFNLGTIPLPGLSKTVWSATLYYENEGYSARIATRARSKYIGEVTNFANERAIKFVKGDQITDFQTSYEFSGMLKGLSVLFQVNNLTNSPYIAYQRVEAQQIDYQTYGRQFLLGANFKL